MDRAKAWFSSHHKESIHPQFERIKALFLFKYKEAQTSLQRFFDFIQGYKLDVSRSYRDQARDYSRLRELMHETTFVEGFNWIPPEYIHKIREDHSAKYYMVECLDAVVSMNNKNYTDVQRLESAGKSMNYRPISINHNFPPRGRWVGYPRTRLEYSKTEDMTLEGILRVDNQDAWLQKAIAHDPSVPREQWISQPSIEGRPDLVKEDGYHFMALSLLEMGYALPGVPTLAPITPFFQESVDGSCVFLDSGVKFCLEEEGICRLSEQVTPPEFCVCPKCGHMMANPEGKHCPDLKCSECGSAMRARQPGTGGGRGVGGPEGLTKIDISINEKDPKIGVKTKMSNREQTNFRCKCPSCGHVVENASVRCEGLPCPECRAKMEDAGTENMSNAGTHAVLESSEITEEIAEAMLVSLEAENYDCDACLTMEALQPKADWPDSCFAYVKGDVRKFPYKDENGKISLPNVKNALARLAGAAIPDGAKARIKTLMQNLLKRVNPDYEPSDESLEQMVELYRPPWPVRPASQFGGAQKMGLKNAAIPTVGSVMSNVPLFEEIKGIIRKDLDAEYATREAAHISEKTSLENKVASLEEQLRGKDKAYGDLQKKVAGIERTSGKTLEQLTGMKGEVGELTNKKVLLEQQVSERDGTIRQLQESISDRDATIKRLEGDITKLREEVGAVNASMEDIRLERNNLSVKHKGSEEKALQETRERSRIQQENAGLRDEVARYVNEVARLSTDLANKSKTLLIQESAISEKEGKIRTLEDGARKLLEQIEEVKTHNKQAWKKLNQEGIFAISKKGDLIVGTPDIPKDG